MDKLQAMNAFVRVVESGSFSAVARELNATQSAISKQVAALEAALGGRLLTRTTRALSLTEEGARYFEQARRLVAEIAEAESAVRSGGRELTGWLRVAASVGYGRLRVMPLVQSFLARHRSVRVDLRLSDGFVDLIEQGIDIAVRLGELPDSSLVARRVATTPRWLMAHRDHLRRLPKARRAPRTPEDLLHYNCIVYTEVPWRSTWKFTAGPGAAEPVGSARTVQVQGNLQTNSSEVIRAAVLAGMGIGFSPTWLFEEELASGAVQHLLPDWEAAGIPIHLVSPPQRHQSAKVRAFAEHVAQALGQGKK
ncbi:MAG: LysR family transcriptional regulator [Gammaproteobacteria bacterium]|nr:LysR family transcriptional regulator [Gammaproteobacteria bacterium]